MAQHVWSPSVGMQSLSPQTQQRPWEEGKKQPLQGARAARGGRGVGLEGFACSGGGGRGTEVGGCQGRNQAGGLRRAGKRPQLGTPGCGADKVQGKGNTGLESEPG